MEKNDLLVWAMHEVERHVRAEAFGTVTIAMANGKISGIKTEINHKPTLDHNGKNT